MDRLDFNEGDLANAKLLLEEEKLEDVTKNEIFKAGMYCILAQAERYDKQIRIYRRLLGNKLDSPERVLEEKNGLHYILKKARYPNEKEKRIKDLAQWWMEAVVPHSIVKDINNSRKKGVELRNTLAEEAPGIGYKSASLLMIKCGYMDVAPIDIWMLRFLKEQGCDVDLPDYLTVGGMTKDTYLRFENVLRKMAEDANVSLALFQATIWGKYSTWKVRKERRMF